MSIVGSPSHTTTSLAQPYIVPTRGIWLCFSDTSSWLMHTASIQRFRGSRVRKRRSAATRLRVTGMVWLLTVMASRSFESPQT